MPNENEIHSFGTFILGQNLKLENEKFAPGFDFPRSFKYRIYFRLFLVAQLRNCANF